MKTMTLNLTLILNLILGCFPRETTLDEEISSLPVSWSGLGMVGASSNNWALLDRVSTIEDSDEKIRLVTALRDHLRSSPEQILANDRHGTFAVFNEKMRFEETCAWRLISESNKTPRVVLEGWRLNAAWIDDLERLMDLTEGDWNNGIYDREASEQMKKAWNFSSRVRRIYELYFKYTFAYCVVTYRQLPLSSRPAFIEQIKRDFFGREGMKYVDMDEFPPEFKCRVERPVGGTPSWSVIP